MPPFWFHYTQSRSGRELAQAVGVWFPAHESSVKEWLRLLDGRLRRELRSLEVPRAARAVLADRLVRAWAQRTRPDLVAQLCHERWATELVLLESDARACPSPDAPRYVAGMVDRLAPVLDQTRQVLVQFAELHAANQHVPAIVSNMQLDFAEYLLLSALHSDLNYLYSTFMPCLCASNDELQVELGT